VRVDVVAQYLYL